MSRSAAERRLRVVLVADWFLRYAAEQAAGLVDAGADVCLVCRDHAFEFGESAADRGRVLDEARARGVTILSQSGRVSAIGGWRSAMGIARLVRAWRPDVAHAHINQD